MYACDRQTQTAMILLMKKWAVTLLVRARHGWNSSDNRVVPSVYVRLCLFTITMFCFENEAVNKDLSCLALHSVVQNKMLQHSYTTKKLVVTNSSPETTLWLHRGLQMSDVSGLYVNAKHVLCHNIMYELIPGSPPPFYFHQSEWRAWEQGYTPFLFPIMLYLNTQLSKVLFVCTSNSLPPQSHKNTISLSWNKTQDCYRRILNYL